MRHDKLARLLTHRQIRYRLIPGSCAKAAALARLTGACRFIWNHFLAANQEAMKLHQEGKSDKPSTSFYSLARQFTELRREIPWLQELPFAPVRYVLKYQADAFKRFFEHGGHPRFKARGGGDSVTIPDNIRIRNGKLHIPKLGWYRLRRRGSNPYPDARPVQAVIRRELGKWYVTVCYAVPDIRNGPESPLFNGYSQERTRGRPRYERAAGHDLRRQDHPLAGPEPLRSSQASLSADDGSLSAGQQPQG